jgi:hypothetical protein
MVEDVGDDPTSFGCKPNALPIKLIPHNLFDIFFDIVGAQCRLVLFDMHGGAPPLSYKKSFTARATALQGGT